MKKRLTSAIILLLLVSLSVGLGAGCQKTEPQQPQTPPPVTETSLINPVGPLVLPIAGISSGSVKGPLTVNVSYWKSNDEAIGLLAANKADFAVLPVTMAANLYAANKNIVMLGVHEWKVFYLVAKKGVTFTDWSSLKGKSVYMPVGKGQTVDVLTRVGLTKEKLVADQDVKFVYAPPQEIVSLFQAGKIDFAAIPEPYVTLALKDTGASIVLDYQQYWGQVTGLTPQVPIAGLFVKKEYLDKNPQAAKDVAKMLADSTDWCNVNPDQAIEQAKATLPLPPAVMKESLQRTEFKYISSTECREAVKKYLETVNQVDPTAMKQLPDQGFYGE